jgi:hypothetical protein
MSAPRPYDLSNPDEIKRLLLECHGYLKTCHHKHGTDWEGRQFAIDALHQYADGRPVPAPAEASPTPVDELGKGLRERVLRVLEPLGAAAAVADATAMGDDEPITIYPPLARLAAKLIRELEE